VVWDEIKIKPNNKLMLLTLRRGARKRFFYVKILIIKKIKKQKKTEMQLGKKEPLLINKV